jgi:hypothetical protein
MRISHFFLEHEVGNESINQTANVSNSTVQALNSSEGLMQDITPGVVMGNEIISTIYNLILWFIKSTFAFVINFVLHLMGVEFQVSPELTGLLLSIIALSVLIIKWRGWYGAIKVYFYAILVVLVIFIFLAAIGVLK